MNGRTIYHVGGTDTRELCTVVDDAFSGAYDGVEQDMAVKVDEGHSREDGLGAVDAYTDHLTVKGKVFSWSAFIEYGAEEVVKKSIRAGTESRETHC